MGKDWSIRSYKEGDEHRINALFNTIFHKSRTLERWKWEFKGNPEGFKALIAEHGKDVIAHLGALHRTIKIGQERCLASLEVDGMTHPDFTRRGIFVALGKRLLSESEKEGIAIVIGFPNENALPGHREMDCIELFTPPVMIRPINFQVLSKKLFGNRVLRWLSQLSGKFVFRVVFRVKKPNMEKNVTFTTIGKFDERFDNFWEEASTSHTVILRRDRRYMNWRYADHPEKHYQIFVAEKEEKLLALVVVRVMEHFDLISGAIVDILALPGYENAAHALMLKAMEHLTEKKVDLIACLMPKSSDYNRLLRKCGFVKCPRKLNPKEEPFIIYPVSKDIDMGIAKNPDNWFITWGDTDVV